MSLYNALFGFNPYAPLLLPMLGVIPAQIPRFRDCFLKEEDGKLVIVIHTRTGGGNRPYYDEPNNENIEGPWNSDLRALPGFIRDEDSPYDTTYANFYFDVPESCKTAAQVITESMDPNDKRPPEEKWARTMDALRSSAPSPERERALKIGAQIMGQVKQAFDK